MPGILARLMPAYYCDCVSGFRATPNDRIENQLSRGYENDRYADLKTKQIGVWRQVIKILRSTFDHPTLSSCSDSWGILLEFPIPRRMGRIDCVLLIGDAIAVLEFKSGLIDSGAIIQVEDYALDLKYFHRPSHSAAVYPIVIGENKPTRSRNRRAVTQDIEGTRCVSPDMLADELRTIAEGSNRSINAEYVSAWNCGSYHPVPSVIEAAVGMFQEMRVDDIAHADADVVNLSRTVDTLRSWIGKAALERKKVVCFVTGVPGAGKTLAGLKLVHDSELRKRFNAEIAFLSGNEPLVTVLQSALTRDIKRRRSARLPFADRDPKTCIQLVLSYKKTELKHDNCAFEQVLVFDEAQRAWDMKTTQASLDEDVVESFRELSEPGLILSVLDRHKDWAVLVALVGNGQEINTGEAGLPEWGRTLAQRFRHWDIVASPFALDSGNGTPLGSLFTNEESNGLSVISSADLHLDNPNRQFRGRTIAEWADAVLDLRCDHAARVAQQNVDYPITITRDLGAAKEWVRSQSRGSERFGIICSSGAKRLRADGVVVPGPKAPDIDHWFLGPKGDVRSSFQLEVAATEFQVQGLEVDWAVVGWGGDLSFGQHRWHLSEFLGTKWVNVKSLVNRNYLINTYRVLLTRARQGFVIYVPTGTESDNTHSPQRYDGTFEYLRDCGAVLL